METLKTQKKQEIQPKKNDTNFFKPVIQKKLSVGSANDSHEVEADQVADQVMKMSEPSPYAVHTGALIQKKGIHSEPQMQSLAETITPLIQCSSTENGRVASDHIESQINSSKGSGSSMDSGTKSFMENRFGADFSNVKVHTGREAVQMSRDLNAQAFAVGNDIYFNEGKYNPSSDAGKHLLAHELTHTIQQSGGIGLKIQKVDDADLYLPGENLWFDNPGQARIAAVARAASLGPAYRVEHHPAPVRGLPHYHIFSDTEGNIRGHYFYRTSRRRRQRRETRRESDREYSERAARVARAAAIGAGAGMILGGVIGAVGGGAGGTLVAPGVGTIGVGAAGGAAGAAYGAALGGLVGGAVMGGGQALYDWIND